MKSVEARFSKGADSCVSRVLSNRIPVLGSSLSRVVWMDAGAGKDGAELIGNLLGSQTAFGRCRNAQDGFDAGSAGPVDNLAAVRTKAVLVEVSMRVDQSGQHVNDRCLLVRWCLPW